MTKKCIRAITKLLLCLSVGMAVIVSNPSAAHESYKFYVNDAPHYISSVSVPDYLEFICTAYDLSYQSCQKTPEHPAYGITASGVSLKDHTRESAMAIAVDPNQIPLGSKVLIVFEDENRAKYNGVYTAVDTGGAINGNRIDIFFGDEKEDVSNEAIEFGRASAKVLVLS